MSLSVQRLLVDGEGKIFFSDNELNCYVICSHPRDFKSIFNVARNNQFALINRSDHFDVSFFRRLATCADIIEFGSNR